MRAAAQRQEPAPEAPDLGAWLARVLARLDGVLGEISGNPAAAAAVRELADIDVTLLHVRSAYERSTAQVPMADELVALGRQIERAAQSWRPASAPRPRATGQMPLLRAVQP